MFDYSALADNLRTHTTGWLRERRAWLVAEQRRLHVEELAIVGVLDERRALDDSLAATDGVSVREVRATVETARALASLPNVAAAAHEGRLSDGQLAAVVQLADGATDGEWAERAPRCSPIDLQRAVRAQRTPTVEESRARQERRGLRIWLDERTGTYDARLTLPDLTGAAVFAAVEARAERIRPAKGRSWAPRHQRMADALVALVLGEAAGSASPVKAHVVVNVPVRGPAEVSGIPIADELLEQVLANATIEAHVVDEHGTVVGSARATTTLAPKVHRAVRARDGHCRWPGCTADVALEVHHLVPRSHGGADDFANLAAVCIPHHRQLVPHGPFALVGVPSRVDGLRLVRYDDPAAPRAGPSG